jgi:hypothetical protein
MKQTHNILSKVIESLFFIQTAEYSLKNHFTHKQQTIVLAKTQQEERQLRSPHHFVKPLL